MIPKVNSHRSMDPIHFKYHEKDYGVEVEINHKKDTPYHPQANGQVEVKT